MCLNKIGTDRKQFLRLKWTTFLAVVVSKCLADSPLTTIFHFHAPLYFPVPARSRSRSNKTLQEKLFLWYFRCYWMQHQQEISWERLFLHSFQAHFGNPSDLVEINSKEASVSFGEENSFSQHFWSSPPYSQGAQAFWQMVITEKTVLHGRLKIVWTCISTQLSNVKWRHLQTYSPLSSKTHQSYLRAHRASGLQPHYLHTEASGGDDLQQGGCPPLASAHMCVLQEGSQSPKRLRWWRGKRVQKKRGKTGGLTASWCRSSLQKPSQHTQ